MATAAVAGTLLASAASFGPPGVAAEGFVNGEASASAETFRLNIVQGNANIGFAYGTSMASYRDRTANAEARAIDLGVLPTLFAVEQCDGSIPVMNPDTLPPKTFVDSESADAAGPHRVQVFGPGFDGGPHGDPVGFQDAAATPVPASVAKTESVDTDMSILALEGGRTEVRTQLVDGVREARAITTATELRVFNNLFAFQNPRWEAVSRSGNVEQSAGSFTFDRATVLGVEKPREQALADFAGFEEGLEWLLRPLGVDLELPEVKIEGRRAVVTPMAFRLKDMPFGRQVIAPWFDSFDSQRQAASQRLVREDCKNALEITLIDIILGIAAGSGAVEILAGGVDAFTADTDFTVPPLDPLPPLALGTVELAPPPPAPPVTAPPPPTTTPPTTEPRTRTVRRVMPAAVSSRYEDSDAGSAGIAVGAAALVGALGLTAGERLLSRRKSRSAP